MKVIFHLPLGLAWKKMPEPDYGSHDNKRFQAQNLRCFFVCLFFFFIYLHQVKDIIRLWKTDRTNLLSFSLSCFISTLYNSSSSTESIADQKNIRFMPELLPQPIINAGITVSYASPRRYISHPHSQRITESNPKLETY